MRRIIDTRAKIPPGGWRYEQPYGEGKVRRFASTPEFSELCQRVSGFRKANKMERSSMFDTSLDVEAFMVAIPGIGSDNRYTYEVDAPGQAIGVPTPPSGCGSCGAKI